MPDQNQPFEFGCSTHIFPPEELAALQARGTRLEALAGGQIAPEGKVEKHFLRVHRGEAKPETVEERAWVRLQGRRELEREEEGARATKPKEDYGIIEWDQEKCWW